MNFIASRLLNPYLTLVAGLALAGGAALASGGWREPETSRAVSPARIAGPRVVLPARPLELPLLVFYLVSSQEEADRATALDLDAGLNRAATLQGEPAYVRVIMVRTTEEEEAAMSSIREQTRDAEGVAIRFYDLRR